MTKNKKLVKKRNDMPKVYSEEERSEIVRRLKKEANELIRAKGVKKTTVDELVRRTGIPKGTFYLFYPSKEMLLFECAQDFHQQVNEHIALGMEKIIGSKSIEEADLSCHADEVTDVIMGAIEITRNSCLRVLLQPESMALVLDKLPEDVLKRHRARKSDNGIIETLIVKKGLSVEEMSGAFTMILFGGMYEQVIGEKMIDNSTRLLVRGLIKQILE
jgi:AcrR family transcriptional regulator